MSDESSALLLPNSPSPFLYSRSFIFFDLKPTGQLKPYKEESSFDIFDVDHFINALKDDIRVVRELPEELSWSTRAYTYAMEREEWKTS